MAEEKTPIPQDAPEQTPAAPEKPPAYTPPASQEKRRKSVIHYVTILFAAAFALMLMTYVMERRQNEAVVDSLTQSVSGLRESITNMESTQDIYDDNVKLMEELNQLNDQLEEQQAQLDAIQQQLEEQTNAAKAMDWFWQIDEAYVRYAYTTARNLIQAFEETDLVQWLPKESITETDRLSPAERYQQIYDNLY